MFAQKLTSVKHKPSDPRGDVSFEKEFTLVDKMPKPVFSPVERKELAGEKLIALAKSSQKSMGTGAMSLPPSITYAPTVKHKYRFVNTSVASSACTAQALVQMAGNIAVSSTVYWSIASTVRIHSIDIWPAASSTAPEECSVQWQSPVLAVERDDRKGRDVPTGISVTGRLHTVPPKGTLAADWMSASSVTVMLITAPIGSVVDVVAEHTFSNALSGVSATVSSGLTVGDVYYEYLDGLNRNYPPVGRTAV